jgi:hypothetical protein
VKWHYARPAARGINTERAPEKRKVGSSTLPLTTPTYQPRSASPACMRWGASLVCSGWLRPTLASIGYLCRIRAEVSPWPCPRSAALTGRHRRSRRRRLPVGPGRCGAWPSGPGRRCTWRRSSGGRRCCARPIRRLGRWDAVVEPGAHAGMPQVINAPGERRGVVSGREGCLPCSVPAGT